jgi:hypothetical protein
MAEKTYDHLIITRPPEKFIKHFSSVRKCPQYVDGKNVPGGFYSQAHWWYKSSKIGHPSKSHSHADWDEYLGFVGTNFKDPFDLGGEVELWLGGEKYSITQTCMVFVPAGLEHCPVYFRRVDTPIYFLATGPKKIYDNSRKPAKKK